MWVTMETMEFRIKKYESGNGGEGESGELLSKVRENNAQDEERFKETQAHDLEVAKNAGSATMKAPKMHSGGIVPKDGVYTLQKGEKVIPAPKKDKTMKNKSTEAKKSRTPVSSQDQMTTPRTIPAGKGRGTHSAIEENRQ
jgi:hypothetical protein